MGVWGGAGGGGGSRLGEGTQGRVKAAVVARPWAETPVSLLWEIDQQFDH